MTRFVYRGGREFDESDLPASVVSFGVKFIEGTPTEVAREAFKSDADYQHALRKLRAHSHFQEVNDEPGTVEVLDAPRKRTRRPPEVQEVEDAAE